MYIDSDKKISTSCLDIYRSNSLSWQQPMRVLPLLSETDWQDVLYSDNVQYPYVQKGDIVIKFKPTRWRTGITQNPRARKQMSLLFHPRSPCSHTTLITQCWQWSRRSAYQWDRKKTNAFGYAERFWIWGYMWSVDANQKKEHLLFSPLPFHYPLNGFTEGWGRECPYKIGRHFKFAVHHLMAFTLADMTCLGWEYVRMRDCRGLIWIKDV